LVESLSAARLLLLVTYRPGYEHRWGSKTAYSQLRLDSQPAESAHELLAVLLGTDPGLAPLTRRLVKRGRRGAVAGGGGRGDGGDATAGLPEVDRHIPNQSIHVAAGNPPGQAGSACFWP
jgi:hypothetical protein